MSIGILSREPLHASVVREPRSARYRATATEILGGTRLAVVAADARDTSLVMRSRGLGFADVLTEGDHHVRHHLALARGDQVPHDHEDT